MKFWDNSRWDKNKNFSKLDIPRLKLDWIERSGERNRNYFNKTYSVTITGLLNYFFQRNVRPTANASHQESHYKVCRTGKKGRGLGGGEGVIDKTILLHWTYKHGRQSWYKEVLGVNRINVRKIFIFFGETFA